VDDLTRNLARAAVAAAALAGCGCAGGERDHEALGGPTTTGAAGAGAMASANAGGGTGAGGGGSAGVSAGAGGAAGASFTEADWALLRTLAPDVLPPPVSDPSNRFADDPKAAAFGEKLFFESGFSGAMLDLDDDGGPNSLGVRGQTGKVPCAGCHAADVAFLDMRSRFREISLGTGWTGRRTPTLLDVGQAEIVMWGGRRSTLYSQVFGPIENPLEMNSSRLFVAEWISEHYKSDYEAVFGAADLAPLSDTGRFPLLTPTTTGCRITKTVDHPRGSPPDAPYDCHGMPSDNAEYDSMSHADQDRVTRIVVNAGKAISAYERLLTCGPGRFDAWVHGDNGALTASEQRGVRVFIGPGKCAGCHSGPYLSDQRFHNIGVAEGTTRAGIFNGNDHGAARDLVDAAADPLGIAGPYSDGNDGRMPTSVGPEYEGAFRTPTLRCVGGRPSFMHSGLVHTLEEAVALLNRGGDPTGKYVGAGVLSPLNLTLEQQADLVNFLRALDGRAPVPSFR
jgi:cytochrome c peroxidase